jgi:hypothetical protein
MSVTLGSGGVLFNQSTKLRIPFNIIQKTKQQRLEIVKNVLGPPVGVTRNELTMLKHDVAESGKLSFVLTQIFSSHTHTLTQTHTRLALM